MASAWFKQTRVMTCYLDIFSDYRLFIHLKLSDKYVFFWNSAFNHCFSTGIK
jgi:hypothetical protein